MSVTLFVEEGALQGTLDIDSRRIQNLAFTAEVMPDGTIRFVIPDQDPPLTFDGRLEDGAIVGRVSGRHHQRDVRPGARRVEVLGDCRD